MDPPEPTQWHANVSTTFSIDDIERGPVIIVFEAPDVRGLAGFPVSVNLVIEGEITR